MMICRFHTENYTHIFCLEVLKLVFDFLDVFLPFFYVSFVALFCCFCLSIASFVKASCSQMFF